MSEHHVDLSRRETVAVRPPNLLLRVVWFVLIGWWLTGILSAVAWGLNATIIGLPIGLWIINRLPFLATLRPVESFYRVENGTVVSAVEQRPFLLRAVYFLLVGWWLSGLWMGAAYIFLISIVGLPIAFWMYGRIGAVTTLFRA
jgi:uncharacterized membrane protein YccF (DUF307 family)